MMHGFGRNIPTIRFCSSKSMRMRAFAWPFAGRRLTIELLHHGQTQSIQGIGSFVIRSALIVA
jgi:hypothetical protein